MSLTYTPKPYQTNMLRYAFSTPRCALFAGMGLGKTITALTLLQALDSLGEGPALVLAPLRVAASTWPREARKWRHLQGFHVQPIVGGTAQRERALATSAPVYTINYDNLPWLITHFYDRHWPFTTIVADEATRLKNFRLRQGGKRTQALAAVAHLAHVQRFINLTGTPTPNGLLDLWGQIWFLDRGQRLGRSFSAFRERYFRARRVGADPHAVQYEALPGAKESILNAIADICYTVEAREHFDLREPIVREVLVTLPLPARRAYHEIEKNFLTELENGANIEAANTGAKVLKCLQIASGALYTAAAGKAWHVLHTEKIDALRSILEEAAGAPVLLAYHFKSDAAEIKRAFPYAKTLDQDPATIDAWNAGKILLLIAHPQSAGHGLNLQDGGNILVFYTCWWNLETYAQMVERIGPVRQAQSGHNRPVFVYHIIAQDTLDDMVLARLRSKASLQQAVVDYMKGKQL